VDALGAPTEVAQGRLTQPARAAADWIARRFGLDHAVVRLLVTTFCREVHNYLTDPDRRAAVRETVAETIAAERPRVLLAHSLGSVAAYEALWARPDLQVELLVTLGSPLAMPNVIFDRLQPGPTNGRGQRPPGVRRWINIADPGDIIAIPRGLARSFYGIDADLTTPVGVFDFHKVAGYLSCTTTAAALATLLGR
jgi:pimeloyl-ACP methyl ester carboxylesterase